MVIIALSAMTWDYIAYKIPYSFTLLTRKFEFLIPLDVSMIFIMGFILLFPWLFYSLLSYIIII
jgi:hypothetical protein